MKIDTSKIDVAAVFLGFVACVGDIQKTSLMFDLAPDLVERLAEENQWTEKIRRLSLVSKNGEDGDWAKMQNRALCFVQGTMLRKILQNVLENVNQMTREDLAATVTAVKAGSVTFTARFYADLAAAMQSAHSLCYQALGDTASERKELAEGKDGDGLDSFAKLHAAVNLALSNPAAAGAERRLLENEVIDIPKK